MNKALLAKIPRDADQAISRLIDADKFETILATFGANPVDINSDHEVDILAEKLESKGITDRDIKGAMAMLALLNIATKTVTSIISGKSYNE